MIWCVEAYKSAWSSLWYGVYECSGIVATPTCTCCVYIFSYYVSCSYYVIYQFPPSASLVRVKG